MVSFGTRPNAASNFLFLSPTRELQRSSLKTAQFCSCGISGNISPLWKTHAGLKTTTERQTSALAWNHLYVTSFALRFTVGHATKRRFIWPLLRGLRGGAVAPVK